MASYACNLACAGCSNYSDLSLKGYVKWNECKSWLEQWLERINIVDFGIIGGEPLANPEIDQWIVGSRSLMPDAQLRFTTNGLLLHKKLEIAELLHQAGNSVLKISVHLENNKIIENTIEEIFSRYNFEEVEEFGIRRYKTSNNFRFQINRPKTFIKSYKNFGKEMLPYNSNPKESFDACMQQNCPLLYKGKIYKCSSSGMLGDILEKFNIENIPEWKDFYNYQGISVDDSDKKIIDFVSKFGKPESVCRMCPTKEDHERLIDHVKNVRRQNGKFA